MWPTASWEAVNFSEWLGEEEEQKYSLHKRLCMQLDRWTYRYVHISQEDCFLHSGFPSFAMPVFCRNYLKKIVPSALKRLGGVKENSFSLLTFLFLSILPLEKSQLLACQNSFKAGLWCIETCETEPWQLHPVKEVWLHKKYNHNTAE